MTDQKIIDKLALEADDKDEPQFLADLKSIHPGSVAELRSVLGEIAADRGRLTGQGLGVVDRSEHPDPTHPEFRLAGPQTHIIIPVLDVLSKP